MLVRFRFWLIVGLRRQIPPCKQAAPLPHRNPVEIRA